jgi:hypothetical protein
VKQETLILAYFLKRAWKQPYFIYFIKYLVGIKSQLGTTGTNSTENPNIVRASFSWD